MNRRTFAKRLGGTLAASGLSSGLGFGMPGVNLLQQLLRFTTETGNVLVLVFMEGGNDGLNTVVPLDQLSALSNVRPHVILPENSLLTLPRSEVGLHPSLEGFSSLYKEGRLGIVQNVGYPNPNYSHFRSTDIWLSASDSNELINTGWSGRYLNNCYPNYPTDFPNMDMPDPLAIEIGSGNSLLFQGPSAAMGMSIGDATSFYNLINDIDEPAPDTPAGDQLEYIRLVARQSQQYGEVVKEAAEKVTQQEDFPETWLGEQLKIVSRLIAGGLKTPLYLVRHGGFDTHDNQVEVSDHTSGEHSNLLKELDDAVVAFMKDMEIQGTGDNVVGLTFSEFGRRIVSNASLGTDHGSAQPVFFFGNKVKGGVIGNNPSISPTATYEDNLPMAIDFRQVYASLMQQWLGASATDTSAILFDQFDTVGLIGESTILGVEEILESKAVSVFPNPVYQKAVVEFKSPGGKVSIHLVDLNGQYRKLIFNGFKPRGVHKIEWQSAGLAPGSYVVVVETGMKKHTLQVIVN